MGDFWSIGMNTFMDTWDNDDLKRVITPESYTKIYEEEFERLRALGFNTISGWSDLSLLDNRVPFGIVLFDDPSKYPISAPLINSRGELLTALYDDRVNPIGNPFNEEYVRQLDAYLKNEVEKYRDNEMVLLYWLGCEFGLGDSDAKDFSEYLYSEDLKPAIYSWKIAKGVTEFDQDARRGFATYLIREWLKIVVAKIKKYDPNHLISSPKVAYWSHENFSDRPRRLGHFEAMRGFVDLFSVDWYPKEVGAPVALSRLPKAGLIQLEEVSKDLKVPVLVAEFGLRQRVEGNNHRPGAKSIVETQEERGAYYQSLVSEMWRVPWIIGAHWFKWHDHKSVRNQFNKGIIRVGENEEIVPYQELTRRIKETNSKINGFVRGIR
jgi:hypothetical protein